MRKQYRVCSHVIYDVIMLYPPLRMTHR